MYQIAKSGKGVQPGRRGCNKDQRLHLLNRISRHKRRLEAQIPRYGRWDDGVKVEVPPEVRAAEKIVADFARRVQKSVRRKEQAIQKLRDKVAEAALFGEREDAVALVGQFEKVQLDDALKGGAIARLKEAAVVECDTVRLGEPDWDRECAEE